MIARQNSDRIENIATLVCFLLTLAFHAWGASIGWSNLNLPGCEFRQTQTAISAHFIRQEKNYSLAYPTPVLGKPWSIPMEFPLYQWTVAKVADESGWGLTQVGRLVSLVCFYLTLPALYLLVRRLGVSGGRAPLVLAFVVACPLYIFYARAFLIEMMAWMFGAWFLVGYVLGVERRSPACLVIAAVAGAGAGLVKVTTLLAFLFPAFTWTLGWFWRDWHGHQGAVRWRALAGRAGWCAAGVVLPFGAAWWWVRYSDHIKAQSAAGAFLQSASMTNYNFGVGVRFDPAIWSQHWTVISSELATVPVLVISGIVALFFARARWRQIGLLVFFFFAVQLMFPILYAWHEYYYVAIAMLLMTAVGLAVCGLLESQVPRWAAWAVIVGLLAIQGHAYLVRLYPVQAAPSPGGSELTRALRQVTEPDDILIVAGDDWSSMIPYYAERRAFMIRRDLETTWQLIEPAFAALKGETVGALVLLGPQRENQRLHDLAVTRFQLDPRPAFHRQDADVYLPRQSRALDLALLTKVPGIALPPEATRPPEAALGREIDMSGWRPRHQTLFAMITPRPWKYFSTFGLNPTRYHDHDYVWAHPETRLWFRLPAGRHRLTALTEFIADAYEGKLSWQDRSDGVELVLQVRGLGGEPREIGRKLIDPRANPKDRGRRVVVFDFVLEDAGDMQFAVLPGPVGSTTRDWFLLGAMKIE
ncbi:MAG: hypothetical protein HYV95_12545 [Opitutae bacterium]|nr:hypothetical protein [Opitutae bacterium]